MDVEEDDDRGGGQRFLDWVWDTVRTWAPAILTVLLIRSALAEPFKIPSGSMVPTLEIGDHILVTKSTYGWRVPLTRIPLTTLKVPDRGDIIVFVYPGSDMNPVLHRGGAATYDDPSYEHTLSYWFDLPIPPFATLDYVKRVVGLPGETVEVRNNTVFINGVAQTQDREGDYNFVDDRCSSSPTRLLKEHLDGADHAILREDGYGSILANYGPVTIPDGHVFAMGDNRDHSADSRDWGMVPLRNIKGRARFIWFSYDRCPWAQHRQGVPLLGRFRTERFGRKLE